MGDNSNYNTWISVMIGQVNCTLNIHCIPDLMTVVLAYHVKLLFWHIMWNCCSGISCETVVLVYDVKLLFWYIWQTVFVVDTLDSPWIVLIFSTLLMASIWWTIHLSELFKDQVFRIRYECLLIHVLYYIVLYCIVLYCIVLIDWLIDWLIVLLTFKCCMPLSHGHMPSRNFQEIIL